MAGTSRTGGESVSETGIPAGLNRIKTRRVSLTGGPSSRDDDADSLSDFGNRGVSRHHVKQKQRFVAQRRGKLNGYKEGSSSFTHVYCCFKLVFVFSRLCLCTCVCNSIILLYNHNSTHVNLNRRIMDGRNGDSLLHM